jgi:tetratricopeptide (TPR) repeat protein
LEDEAVSRLAKLMNISVTADMLRNTGGSLNPAAYENYLTALGNMQRFDKPGNLDQAIASLQNAIQTDPGFALGYAELGEAYRLKFVLEHNTHWLDEAQAYSQKAYQQALKVTPDNAEVYSNLGGAYIDDGTKNSMPLAEQALRKSIALSPGYVAYANLGMLFMQQTRFADAAAVLEQALKINANDYMVWNNLMVACEGAGQPDKAKAARKKAEELAEKEVQVKARDVTAQSTLASLYAADKMNEKASTLISASLALAPDDPNVLANIGEAYEYMGDRERALKYVEKSMAKGYALEDIRNTPGLRGLVADPRFKPPAK